MRDVGCGAGAQRGVRGEGAGQPFSRVLQLVDKDPVMKARACRAVRLLMRAYGCMILEHGLFHADPHPGNFLLQVAWLPFLHSTAHAHT